MPEDEADVVLVHVTLLLLFHLMHRFIEEVNIRLGGRFVEHTNDVHKSRLS